MEKIIDIFLIIVGMEVKIKSENHDGKLGASQAQSRNALNSQFNISNGEKKFYYTSLRYFSNYMQIDGVDKYLNR